MYAVPRRARPHDFDYLESFGAAYAQFLRYVPQFLDTFEFRASPACAELLRAVDLLRELNETELYRGTKAAISPEGIITIRQRNLESGAIECTKYRTGRHRLEQWED